ncbi:MAG: hypothetical protein ACI4D8_06310 [Wujia sp.]
MGYRVGLIDKDYNYAVNLMEYVNSRKKLGITISAFSDSEKLINFITSNNIDLLVIGDGMESDIYKLPHIRICGVRQEASGKGFIYKYQSAEEVVFSIIQCLGLTKKTVREKCILYGVYSPIGRSGKTRFALAMCAGLNSIYISLEEYCGQPYSEDDRKNADSFLYYWAANNKELKNLIESISYDEASIKKIVGINNPSDIGQLKSKDIIWLKKCLSEMNIERAVLDIGASMLGSMELLRELDYLYIPVLEDDISSAKLECFKERYRQLLHEMSGSVSYIMVPDYPYDSLEMKKYVEEVI